MATKLTFQWNIDIDISYTLDGASHTVDKAKIEARSQALVVPTELTRNMIICVFCIAEMDKVDKSCFIQLKSILYINAEKYSVFFGIFL